MNGARGLQGRRGKGDMGLLNGNMDIRSVQGGYQVRVGCFNLFYRGWRAIERDNGGI